MGHDAELVQAIVQIEHLAWHISTGLIACLHPHMKTCSLHHLREREEQLKLHKHLDLQILVVLDQEVLCHHGSRANSYEALGTGQQLGATVLP